MKENFKILFTDRMIVMTFFISISLLLIQLVFLMVTFAKTPPQLPLFYQQPWGAKQIVQKQFIFILPAISLFFAAANIVLSALLYKKTPLLSRMFLWGNLFILALATISAFRIVILII